MTDKREKPFSLDMPFGEALARFGRTDPKELKQLVAERDVPLPLEEDAETGSRFLIYATERGELEDSIFKLKARHSGQPRLRWRKPLGLLGQISRYIFRIYLRRGELPRVGP